MKDRRKKITVAEFRKLIGVDSEQEREKRTESAPVEQPRTKGN